MRLCDLPRGSRFRIMGEAPVPIDSPTLEVGMELTLETLDGMYSLCLMDDGTIVHPYATTEVERIDA